MADRDHTRSICEHFFAQHYITLRPLWNHTLTLGSVAFQGTITPAITIDDGYEDMPALEGSDDEDDEKKAG